MINSGSKYKRKIIHDQDGCVDVYSVLAMFDVRCPARQHAIKKLLCAGLRNKGSAVDDLQEAHDAVFRAIEMASAVDLVDVVDEGQTESEEYTKYRPYPADLLARRDTTEYLDMTSSRSWLVGDKTGFEYENLMLQIHIGDRVRLDNNSGRIEANRGVLSIVTKELKTIHIQSDSLKNLVFEQRDKSPFDPF